MQIDMLYGHTVSCIIEDKVYLSDMNAPTDINILRALGVSHIINASNDAVPNKFPDEFSYFNVNIDDNGEQDILEYFDAVFHFLWPDASPLPSVATRTGEVDDDFVLIGKNTSSNITQSDAKSTCNETVKDTDRGHASTLPGAETDTAALQVLCRRQEEAEGGSEEDTSTSMTGYECTAATVVPSDPDSSGKNSDKDWAVKEGDKSNTPKASLSTVEMSEVTGEVTRSLCDEEVTDVPTPSSLREGTDNGEGEAPSSPVGPSSDVPPKTILFHCKMGVSRSATLCIAYLMRAEGKSLKEAFDLTKSKRPKINPTEIFAQALLDYELLLYPHLQGVNTVNGVMGLMAFRASSYSFSNASLSPRPSASVLPHANSFGSSSYPRSAHTISELEDDDEGGVEPVDGKGEGDTEPLQGQGSGCCACCVVS